MVVVSTAFVTAVSRFAFAVAVVVVFAVTAAGAALAAVVRRFASVAVIAAFAVAGVAVSLFFAQSRLHETSFARCDGAKERWRIHAFTLPKFPGALWPRVGLEANFGLGRVTLRF